MSNTDSDLPSRIKSFQKELEGIDTKKILEMLYAALFNLSLKEVQLPEHQETIASLVRITLLSNQLNDGEDFDKQTDVLKTIANTLQTSGRVADQQNASHVLKLIERLSQKIKEWEDKCVTIRQTLWDMIGSLESIIRQKPLDLDALRKTIKNMNLKNSSQLTYDIKQAESLRKQILTEIDSDIKTASHFLPQETRLAISKTISETPRKLVE